MRELVNLETVKILISSARTVGSINLAKLLDIETIDYKIPAKETSNSQKIIKVFKNEKIVLQKQVGAYRADLYFSDYDLGNKTEIAGLLPSFYNKA